MQNYSTYDNIRGKSYWRELRAVPSDVDGIEIHFDEDQLFYRLTETVGRWRGFTLDPGDTMQVKVVNNHYLRIKYRRAGWTGVFERREVRVQGGV